MTDETLEKPHVIAAVRRLLRHMMDIGCDPHDAESLVTSVLYELGHEHDDAAEMISIMIFYLEKEKNRVREPQ